MEHAVIAIFDNYSQAQRAKNELLQAGFPSTDVQMSPPDEREESRRSALGSSDTARDDDDSGWSIGKFFRSLFGSEDDTHRQHADTYSEAMRRGSYMVSVDANSEEQQERASAVLLNCDPVDIEGRSQAWRNQGWSGYDSTAPLYTQEEIARERQGYAASGGAAAFGTGMPGATGMAPGAESGMTAATGMATGADSGMTGTSGMQEQTRVPGMEDSLASRNRVGQGSGVRSFQRMAGPSYGDDATLLGRSAADSSIQRPDANVGYVASDNLANSDLTGGGQANVDTAGEGMITGGRTGASVGSDRMTSDSASSGNLLNDDSSYRNHWQNSYANAGGRYEDYAPAYQYGSTLAEDERYRGHQWNDIEPHVRSDWESRNSGSPWERAREAVRYGWEKMTH